MAILGMWGHAGAAAAVMALVVSTAFLVWVAQKTDNPYRRFGQIIAWIAIVISALLILGQIFMCIDSCRTYGFMRGHRWEHKMMGPGMQRGMMPMQPMGPMGAPQTEEED
jgi:hypothetical protein